MACQGKKPERGATIHSLVHPGGRKVQRYTGPASLRTVRGFSPRLTGLLGRDLFAHPKTHKVPEKEMDNLDPILFLLRRTVN
jgi:hypothetical protein